MKLTIEISDEEYEFIKNLQSVVIGNRGTTKTVQYNVINAIKNGVPYKEKKQGKWKYHKAEDIFFAYMECTACGLEEVMDNEDITPKRFRDYYKYCPNCGASMVKEKKEADNDKTN